MRKNFLWGAAAILVLGTSGALAAGGSGNLSPSESPYAILEPQTLYGGAQISAPNPEEPPPPPSATRRARPKAH